MEREIIILSIIMICTVARGYQINPNQVRVTTGIHTREIFDAELYSATIPLIYDINITFTEPPFNLFENPNCKTSPKRCNFPISMRPLVAQITKNLINIRNDTILEAVNSNRNKRGIADFNPLNLIGDAFAFCCGFVSRRQMNSLFTSDDQVRAFMGQMKKSVIQNNQNVVTLKAGFELFQNNVANLIQRAEITAHTLQGEIKNVSEAINVVEEQILGLEEELDVHRKGLIQTFTTFNMMTETMRFQDIQNHCRQGTLSLLAINSERLTKDLKNINRNLNSDDHELVIPYTQISRYFKLKLADCIFTPEARVVIRLRIPIKRRREVWKLLELINIPFGYKESTCMIQHAPTYLAVSQKNLVAIQGTQLHLCQPDTGLCQIPQFNSDPGAGYLCVQRLLQGASVQSLNQVCMFECMAGQNDITITQLDYHTFVITGALKGMGISCRYDGSNQTYPVIPPKDGIGSLEVKIPCGCQLTIPDRIPIRPPYPCPTGLVTYPVVNLVIPTIMSKVDVMLSAADYTHERAMFPNISSVFNETWHLDTPRLNLTEVTQLKGLVVPQLIHMTPASSDTMLIIWNVILTVAVAVVLYKEFCRNGYILGLPVLNQIEGVKAQSAHAHHIANLTVVTVFLLGIIAGMVTAWIYIWYIRLKLSKRNTKFRPEISSPMPLEDPDAFQLEMRIGERVNIMTPEGNTFKILMREPLATTPHYATIVEEDEDEEAISMHLEE